MMKEAFRGSGIGVIFMAVFGTLWAGTGVMGLQGWGFPYVELAAIFVGIIMVIVGISLIHASQKNVQSSFRRWGKASEAYRIFYLIWSSLPKVC
ncbi:hypothetical protein RCO48_23205 [Peribacillus frigoritolerans]|nr:hypothetical protein [Peribacillus frigoritolerans]